MFARTFAVYAKAVDLGTPRAVVDFVAGRLREELVGRKAFSFTLFADVDETRKKIVFYDASHTEHVIEWSAIFQRLPQLSVSCDGDMLKIYHFYAEEGLARVFSIGRAPDNVILGLTPYEDASRRESEEVRIMTSSTDGFVQSANAIDGAVSCGVVENAETKERLAHFTLRLSNKSVPYRGIIRSCREIFFAWSDDSTSSMILICKFKMLPDFALSFPILGKNLQEAMVLYTRSKKAVGLTVYRDDQSDAFLVEEGRPVFD